MTKPLASAIKVQLSQKGSLHLNILINMSFVSMCLVEVLMVDDLVDVADVDAGEHEVGERRRAVRD